MKKNIFLLAITLIALSSCKKDEPYFAYSNRDAIEAVKRDWPETDYEDYHCIGPEGFSVVNGRKAVEVYVCFYEKTNKRPRKEYETPVTFYTDSGQYSFCCTRVVREVNF